MKKLKIKSISGDAIGRILDTIRNVDFDITGWCVAYDIPDPNGPRKATINEAVYDQLMRIYKAFAEAREIIRNNAVIMSPEQDGVEK